MLYGSIKYKLKKSKNKQFLKEIGAGNKYNNIDCKNSESIEIAGRIPCCCFVSFGMTKK